MGARKWICLHEYEVYGSKSPTRQRIRGREKIGTLYYLRCSKCGKCKTYFHDVVQGDYI